jgi:hypothetical protein
VNAKFQAQVAVGGIYPVSSGPVSPPYGRKNIRIKPREWKSRLSLIFAPFFSANRNFLFDLENHNHSTPISPVRDIVKRFLSGALPTVCHPHQRCRNRLILRPVFATRTSKRKCGLKLGFGEQRNRKPA